MMKLKHTNEYYKSHLFKWRQRIGFGISDYACNLAYLLTNTYLLFYYTNCAGLNAADVGIMFVITKIIDGFTDYLTGTWIDRTDTKMGRYRPWMLFGAPVLAFGMIILFSVPTSWGTLGKMIWAYISYIIFSFGYTLVNIPMTPIVTTLSPDPVERTNIVTTKQMFASLGSLTSSLFVLPLVQFFSGSNNATGSALATGYRMTNVVLGIAVIVLMIICVTNVEEINPPVVSDIKHKEKHNIFSDFKDIFKNKYYIMFLFFVIFFYFGYLVMYAAIQYYFTYIVGDTKLMSIAMSIMTIVPIPIFMLTSILCSKGIKKSSLLKTGSIVAMVSLIFMFFIEGKVATMFFISLWSVGFGLRQSILFAAFPEIFDYTEYQVGRSLAGTQYSLVGFSVKLASALSSALVSALLVWGAYQPEKMDAMLSAGKTVTDLAVAFPSAIFAIKFAFVGISIITNLLAFLVLIPYKLDNIYPQVRKELETMRNS